jgi:CubicO group peptidase (beta-lactamase class C family)
VLLGDILNKSVSGGLEKYSAKKLFEPLGIKNYKWEYTPQGVVNTAGGLRLRSVDYAKFGQLYINEGLWEGKKILSKQWIKSSMTRQMVVNESTNEYYGYLFWNMTFNVNGKEYGAYYSSGNGGNKIFIFKDIPVVVVITSTAYNKPYSHSQVNKMMKEYILPAVIQ